MSAVAAQLPLMELGVRRVDCVSRLCWRTRSADLPDDSLLFVDWTAAERRWPLLARRRHLLVMDPPYRGAQVALLQQAVAHGLSVHLCYAEEDKQFSAEHLRFLLQPRFWMVNLYRAYQTGHEGPNAFEEAAGVRGKPTACCPPLRTSRWRGMSLAALGPRQRERQCAGPSARTAPGARRMWKHTPWRKPPTRKRGGCA